MTTEAPVISSPAIAISESLRPAWQGAKLLPCLILLTFAGILWTLPPLEGLTVQSWHLFIIFITTIFAIIAKPLPMGAVAILGVAFCAATNTLTIDQCLSTFSSSIVWLVVAAFFLARGFTKTGLGMRLAYFFLSLLGKSSLGIAYGFVLTELILSPLIPSSTARGGGIIYPIVTALAAEQGSHPNQDTARQLGAFLIKVCFQVNMITSDMFITGMVGNPLIASLATSAGVTLDWNTWAVAMLVPGLVNLAVLPWALFKIYPPTQKHFPQAAEVARKKLAALGSLKGDEKLMLGTFLCILVLWILGSQLKIDATSTAFIGLGVLLFSGVITWKDVTAETGAWDTMLWFAPLLMMATFLSKLGMMAWISQKIHGHIMHLDWPVAFVLLSLIYFYIHYLFASVTAHITALYGAFLLVLVAMGTPAMLAAMTLAVLTSLCGSLTHFGAGTAPVYFGAQYLSVSEWWRVAFLMSLVNLTIWGLVGGLWWKVLGYW
jgi:DASS family divalent anion:Na+ symporter